LRGIFFLLAIIWRYIIKTLKDIIKEVTSFYEGPKVTLDPELRYTKSTELLDRIDDPTLLAGYCVEGNTATLLALPGKKGTYGVPYTVTAQHPLDPEWRSPGVVLAKRPDNNNKLYLHHVDKVVNGKTPGCSGAIATDKVDVFLKPRVRFIRPVLAKGTCKIWYTGWFNMKKMSSSANISAAQAAIVERKGSWTPSSYNAQFRILKLANGKPRIEVSAGGNRWSKIDSVYGIDAYTNIGEPFVVDCNKVLKVLNIVKPLAAADLELFQMESLVDNLGD
jgi:hypothetical protein